MQPTPDLQDFATDGARAAYVIRKYTRFSDGVLWGTPRTLEPWQEWVLNEMFRIDPETGLRYWREFILMVPRGNDKSGTASALGYYFLCFDNEGAPEIYSAARSEQQARAVFDPARIMWDASPELQKYTRRFNRAITCPTNAGTWRVVSRIAETQQGTKPHVLLNDEYHLHTTGELRDAFIRGMHKRRQPLALDITTEAGHRDTPLGELQRGFYESPDVEHEEIHPYLHVYKVRRSILVRWGVPWGTRLDEVDLENPEVMRACNPASWINVDELIRDELLAPGKREADAARYHANMLVEGGGEGISSATWDSLSNGARLAEGQDVVLGVDVGIRDDCSAIVALGRLPDGRLHAEATVLTPPAEAGMDLDYEDIDDAVEAYARRYRVPSIVCDPMLAGHLMQGWIKRGLSVREFGFKPTQAGPASVELLRLIEAGQLSHDGDRKLREHVLNMEIRDKNTWWRFDKPKDKARKVDAGMALMMAVSEYAEGDAYSLADGLLVV